MIRVKKLTKYAYLPHRATPGSAGLDLTSAYAVTVPAHGKAIIKTDLAVVLPEGTYGRVAPRSSVAWNHHVDIGAGVIDMDFRGNVGVIVFNHGAEDFVVKRGERIAQLIVEKIVFADVEEIDKFDEGDATERGEGGYGSTGIESKE